MPVLDKAGVAWVGFSSKSYENMALNLQDVITYIEQANAVTEYYQTCIAAENTRRLSTGH